MEMVLSLIVELPVGKSETPDTLLATGGNPAKNLPRIAEVVDPPFRRGRSG
ncbi:hypothetical protein Aco03nite_008100 [Actinoplanes couchii]|uniref:Uncharacterized protein n=1 Tax=Actinoplanes couchii TaxID=403638 RepID=A0ABQ3X1Q1_9ACTN|nr:hypothetical protein Aco03nite_008100 [Actinoplanes couchii]